MALTAEDRLEMTDLLGRYNQAIDNRKAEAWADTFTSDGVFVVEGSEPIAGRDALIAMVEAMGENSTPPTKHWVSNLRFDGDGDNATMLADIVILQQNRVLLSGRYVNTLQHTNLPTEADHAPAWKFSKRLFINEG
jgi:uncharacterized protein (TIGR02246 family)